MPTIRKRPNVSVLITDLDNTLWDWFDLWHNAFDPFLTELARVTGIGQPRLKREIKRVHQRHRSSEYAHVLQELPSLRVIFGAKFDPYVKLPSVIAAYRKGRARRQSIYRGVKSTLRSIRKAGALIVGFTESQTFYTAQRIRVFGLDGLLDILYTTKDHGLLPMDELERRRNRPANYYRLKKTEVRIFPTHAKKPDKKLLQLILKDVGCPKGSAVYVGDNLHKDMLMAKQANVFAAHAKYGEPHRDERYPLLADLSFWTKSDQLKLRSFTVSDVAPDVQLNAFPDLLKAVRFIRFRSSEV